MSITRDNKELYLDYFSGREDYFAIQYPKYYCPVNKAFGIDQLDIHFAKNATFGIYVLNKDSKCNLVCIDIDIPKHELTDLNLLRKKEKYEFLKEKLNSLINILLINIGLDKENILLEETGGRGYHIWLFFEDSIEGFKALQLYSILKSYTELDFEFFPKQRKLGIKRKLGNLIKLPLGDHKRYDSQSTFFELVNGDICMKENLEQNLELLGKVCKISLDRVDQILTTNKRFYESEELIVEEDEFILNQRSLYKKNNEMLFDNCTALKNLKKKSDEGNPYTYDEIFHLTNILLSVENNEQFIMDLIRKSYGNKYKSQRTKRELDKIKDFHPTSCKKLIDRGICDNYCSEKVKEKNEDLLLDNTTPTSVYLEPIRTTREYSATTLLNDICDIKNMHNAYSKLRRYHKDEDTMFFDVFDYEFFEENINFNIKYISRYIKNKLNYPFIGYSTLEIPKKLDEDLKLKYRKLVYTTVYDQVYIQSIFNIISRKFEEDFLECSFGYRCNLDEYNNDYIFYDWREYYPRFKYVIQKYLWDSGNSFYICCDIEKYYDNINHDILIEQIRQYFNDDFIFPFLTKVIALYEYESGSAKGLPQGPAYARVLANLYLNEFDKEIKKHCSSYVRYVDDIYIFFKSEEEAKIGLEKIVDLLDKLGLNLSKDEDKKAELCSCSDDKIIKSRIDNLKYGIFEEFKYVQYFDPKQVDDYYEAVDRATSSKINFMNVNEMNKQLPSLLYLANNKKDFNSIIKDKILFIIEYLVRNNCFFPKRLKYIFYLIIDLFSDEIERLIEFYKHLDDNHKIYFLLSIYGKYGINKEENISLLKTILDISLSVRNDTLLGFVAAIKASMGFMDSKEDSEIYKTLIASDLRLIGSKAFYKKDFTKLPASIKEIISANLRNNCLYINKKYILSGINHVSLYSDELVLKNIISNDTTLILSECCKLLSLIDTDSILFRAIVSLIANEIGFKDISIEYLKHFVFEKCKDYESYALENFRMLYNNIEDDEIKRELIFTIDRIHRLSSGHDDFARKHKLLYKQNQCFFYESLEEDLEYDYLEIIPINLLMSSGYEDLDLFKRNTENLAEMEIIPKIKIEVDSSMAEVRLKYFNTKQHSQINKSESNFERIDILKFLLTLEDIYKKSNKYYELLGRVPMITMENLLINPEQNKIIFKSVGLSLQSCYIINTETIKSTYQDEITKMLSLLIREYYFKNDSEKIKEFSDRSKLGINLFLNLFMIKFYSKKVNYRYSFDRYSSLIKELKYQDIDNDFDVSILYFKKRLEAITFRHCQQGSNWIRIANTVLDFYNELAIIHDKIDVSTIKFQNRLYMNSSQPKGIHTLSKDLINLNLNNDNIMNNKYLDDNYVKFMELLNYYSALCIEISSLIKAGSAIKFNNKINKINIIEEFILVYGNTQVTYDRHNTSAILQLLDMYREKTDIFELSINYSLKQLSCAFLLHVFEFDLKDNKIIISNTKAIKNKDFENIMFYITVILPDIENQINSITSNMVNRLIADSGTNIDSNFDILNMKIISCCNIINSLRKSLGIKRYYGKTKDLNLLPYKINCRTNFCRSFKGNANILYGMPLTNRFPSSLEKCSWDCINNEMLSLVFPNNRFTYLIKKLKKGKLFSYKISYIYSSKAKLIWDIALTVSTIILIILLNGMIGTMTPNWLETVIEITKVVLEAFLIGLVGKAILVDSKHWTKKIYDAIHYLSS